MQFSEKFEENQSINKEKNLLKKAFLLAGN